MMCCCMHIVTKGIYYLNPKLFFKGKISDRTKIIKHSVEYISSLWRNKIPKLIAEQAQKDWLEWYYTNKKKGYWKKCSRCGQIKLGHNKFFSKNKTSKDGWYSICKDCRNKKPGSVKD